MASWKHLRSEISVRWLTDSVNLPLSFLDSKTFVDSADDSQNFRSEGVRERADSETCFDRMHFNQRERWKRGEPVLSQITQQKCPSPSSILPRMPCVGGNNPIKCTCCIFLHVIGDLTASVKYNWIDLGWMAQRYWETHFLTGHFLFFLSVPKYHKKTFSAKLKSTRNPPELILNLNNMPGEMKGG